MVTDTKESNRTQASATPSFERQTQYPLPGETAAEQPQGAPAVAIQARQPIRFASLVVSGATIGAMWGLSAVVLAIVGLSGVAPLYIAPVAGIVFGLGLIMLSGVGTAWARMFRFTECQSRRERIVFTTGLAAVAIAGLIGVIVSILNVMFLAGPRFGGVAVIVLGLGLLWHSSVMRRVSRFTHYGLGAHEPSGPLAINALSLAPIRDFFVGLGGVILGILAMLHVASVVLGLVALLVMGFALSVTTTTICGATLATLEKMYMKS